MNRIIEASPLHAKTICDLAEKTWWPAYSKILSEAQIRYMLATIYDEDSIRKQLKNGSQIFLLLLENDKPMAFAAYGQKEEKPEVYKLHKIYCLPEAQGKGYGKMLIEEVIERTLKAGKSVLQLNVNRDNKARYFYENMGFEIAYEEDIPIGEYWMNDYVMQKNLKPGQPEIS